MGKVKIIIVAVFIGRIRRPRVAAGRSNGVFGKIINVRAQTVQLSFQLFGRSLGFYHGVVIKLDGFFFIIFVDAGIV